MTAHVRTGDKVSVVLCGYNQREYVIDAVESVLGQTHQNLELIVVDNGSTDGSREVLGRYVTDPRVQLILHPDNAPITQRLNHAIRRASGDFVSLLYADDYYLPHKLGRQIEEFARLSADYGVVYSAGYRLNVDTGRRWVDPSLKESGDVLEDMLVRHFTDGFINPISPLSRRECFVRYPFHEDMFVEGESIYMRFAMVYKFRYVDEPLVVMREHSENRGKAIKKSAFLALILMERLAQEPEFPSRLLPVFDRFQINFLNLCGWLGIRMAADPTWARECAISAIRRRPQQLLNVRTLATLALSTLPVAGLRLFNRAMNVVRRHRETVAFKADYS